MRSSLDIGTFLALYSNKHIQKFCLGNQIIFVLTQSEITVPDVTVFECVSCVCWDERTGSVERSQEGLNKSHAAFTNLRKVSNIMWRSVLILLQSPQTIRVSGTSYVAQDAFAFTQQN